MRSSVKYLDQIIDFDIEYRKRRTMAIHVRPPGNIMVFSPLNIPERVIMERVKSKGRWILKKLIEVRSLDPEEHKKDFIDGEAFLFLGKNHDLRIVSNVRKIPKVFLKDGIFFLETSVFDPFVLRKAMEKWYRKKADRILNDRIEYFRAKIGKSPRSAKAKDQKRRWGSCTARGDIYFNWRLVMAPPGIIDYIVVHEMCHLINADHSRRFWDRVGSVLPDYKKRKKWLKENGLRLDI